jgi:acetylornithine deacetylase/succinyl-diaminopimelate desuccinylase-like protein
LTIEGLVGGYTGPGGKTIVPSRLTAKLDIRLVPDMTPEDTIAKVKAHLAKRGFGDLDVNVNGGVNYVSSTPLESSLIQSQLAVYRKVGIDPLVGRLGVLARLGVHRRASSSRRPLLLGYGGAAGRVHADRLDEPEAAQLHRPGALLRRLPVRDRVITGPIE